MDLLCRADLRSLLATKQEGRDVAEAVADHSHEAVLPQEAVTAALNQLSAGAAPTKTLAIIGAATGTIGTLWARFLRVVYDRARVIHVETVSRVVSAWRGKHELSADIGKQLMTPVRLEEGQSHSFVHGGQGG
jgi:hypothetical protein